MPPEKALGGKCLIEVLCRIDDNSGDRLGSFIGGKHTGWHCQLSQAEFTRAKLSFEAKANPTAIAVLGAMEAQESCWVSFRSTLR